MDYAKRKGGEGGRQEGRHGGPVGGRLSLTTCCFCISSRRDHGPPFADCSRAPCAVDTLFSPGPAARSSLIDCPAMQHKPTSGQGCWSSHADFFKEQTPMCPSFSISASNNLPSHCWLLRTRVTGQMKSSPAVSPWSGLTMQVLKVLHCTDARRTPTSQ